MLLNTFDFNVPDHLIAQTPHRDRDQSRMMVVHSKKQLTSDRYFHDLPDELPPGSLIVLNDTRVFPARVPANLRTGGKAELLVSGLSTSPDGPGCVIEGIARPLKKIVAQGELFLSEGLIAKVVENSRGNGSKTVTLQVNANVKDFQAWLERNGQMPLPPYIKREKQLTEDRTRYQTIYGTCSGSAAAPTAGLHFSESTFDRLRAKGIKIAPLTLHVGLGTFLPIESSNVERHKMHGEMCFIPSSTKQAIVECQREGLPVVAVGTTTLRTLEGLWQKAFSSSSELDLWVDRWFETDIFICPDKEGSVHRPWCVDALLTNFHQPKSSLFVLMCALLGQRAALSYYHRAIENDYRFFSYGDCGLYWLPHGIGPDFSRELKPAIADQLSSGSGH